MRLSVWFDDQSSASLEPYIDAKLRSTLRRHAHRLSSGEIRIRHESTAEGRIAHCSLDLHSFVHGTIHIDEADGNDYAAIAKAIRAAAVKLKRTAERRKDNGRRRGRAGKAESRSGAELQLLAN